MAKNNTRNDAKGKSQVQDETEDVCFVCKDGGNLIVCDHENCGKAYHPDCLDKEDSFFDNVDYWVCDRHSCGDCKKTPEFYCLGCPNALCRECYDKSYFLILRGIKGLCFYCFELVEMIVLNLDHDSEGNKISMDDKETYEYFFKAYWEGVRVKEGFKNGVNSPAKPNCIKTRSSLYIEGEEEKQNDSRSSDSNGDHTSNNTPTKRKRYNYGKSKSSVLSRNCSEGEEEETQNEPGSSDRDGDQSGKNKLTKRRYNSRKRKSFVLGRICSEGEEETPNESSSLDSDGDKNKPANVVEFEGWGSKPLVSFLKSIGKFETERMVIWDVRRIIVDYINEKNLRHPGDKKKFHPDEKLFPIFGKKIMIMNHVFSAVEKHIVEKVDDSARETKDDQNGNCSKDKNHLDQTASIKRKFSDLIGKPLLKKGDLCTKPCCYASINAKNIKLVYLKQSLVMEFSKQPESFKDKVVGTFVRAKVISNDHKPRKSYNLVRVLGVVRDEVHNGILLQVSFIPNAISISELSDEDFTEEECEDLKQKVEASMLQKLTVEELQEKAQILHEDITKHWIATRLVQLQSQIDRANIRGRAREKDKLLDEREELKKPWKQEELLKRVPSVSPELIYAKYNDSDED